ncbi:MAG: hypothetical protein LQ343_002930 [Gyalolechia ehrenbergii]|nr:MAG: hypothetical protein LQ343_002930 [Gyalolechia ehrenbergii]
MSENTHSHLSPHGQTQGNRAAATPSPQQTPLDSKNVANSSGLPNMDWLKLADIGNKNFINPTNSSVGYRYRVTQIKRIAAISKNLSPDSQDQLTWFIDVKLLDLRTASKHNMDDAKLMGELEDLSGLKDSLRDGRARSELIDRLIEEKFNALVDANR